MNPFDLPPSTSPVSTDPPVAEPVRPGRSRGRMAIVAVAAVGLIGGGVAGVSQLASADRSEPAAGAPDDDATAPIDPVDPVDESDEPSGEESTDEPSDEPTGEPAAPQDHDEPSDDPAAPSIDGEIVIDVGDGEPIVVDLGELLADGAAFDEFAACTGFDVSGFPAPPFDREVFPDDRLDLDDVLDDVLDDLLDDLLDEEGGFELPPFGGVVSGTHVTIVGPDGVSIVDLGDGDGSVTINRQDGEVTITTEGDASVEELGELFGELPIGEDAPGAPLDEHFDDLLDDLLDDQLDDQLDGQLDEFLDRLPPLDDAIGEFDFPDAETIEECLDQLRDR